MKRLLLSIFLILSLSSLFSAYRPSVELSIEPSVNISDELLHGSFSIKGEFSILRWKIGNRHSAHASILISHSPNSTIKERQFIHKRNLIGLSAGYGYMFLKDHMISLSLFWGYCHYSSIFAGELFGGAEAEYSYFINSSLCLTFPINLCIMNEELSIGSGIGIRTIL